MEVVIKNKNRGTTMEDKLNEEKLDETTNEELGASLGRPAMIKCLVFTESNIAGRCLAAG